jgi:hypothetical protein
MILRELFTRLKLLPAEASSSLCDAIGSATVLRKNL